MHIHVGVLKAVNDFLHVIAVGLIWRLISMHIADTAIGQAMAVFY